MTAAASVTRNLLRAADFLPFGFGCAIVSMLRVRTASASATSPPRRWWCTTRPMPRARAHDGPAARPVRPLGREDQAALIALAARAPRLTAARLDELAALAAVVSGDEGRSGPQVTRRVLGVAQWALGRAMMTPLRFEQLHQDEWSELEKLHRVGRHADDREVDEPAADPRGARRAALPARLRAPRAGTRPRLSRLHRRPARADDRGCPSG